MAIKPIELELDLGANKDEARRYARDNPEVTLGNFLRLYPTRSTIALPADYLAQALKSFQIIPVKLAQDKGVETRPTGAQAGQLRRQLDELHANDQAEPGAYPPSLSDGEAVKLAYRHELQAAAGFLKNGLSVLIVCDKILTEYIYEYVCQLAGKKPVLDDAVPEGSKANTGQALDRAMQGNRQGIEANLPLLIRNLKEGQLLVLRSVDSLDTPPLIEVLYQGAAGGNKPQLLGFLDPSLEAKKVLTDRFAVRFAIMGLPRHIQPDPNLAPVYTVTRLITAQERACFEELDPEGLFKNVSGLNAIQFRNAMCYVGATVAPGSESRRIYDVIRQFKTSANNEIEIPDTDFEDIGGYDQVKRELKRIVALVTGRVPGLADSERKKLIPRGFIFHGPPGTGKTLFAKAIANEMNANIQMVSGPEIMDKYVGQSESNLRHIFATARRNAPSVIFFDEFDSVAGQRSNYSDGGARANNAVVAQLLTELDGFHEDQAVLLIGTTNRIDIIDEALLRPSRLKPIEIGNPDYAARRSVAGIHAARFGVDKLLLDLYQLVREHLPLWEQQGEVPAAFLQSLFDRQPACKLRYAAEDQRTGLLRDLQEFYQFVRKTRLAETPTADNASSPLAAVEAHLLQIGKAQGVDLAQAAEAHAVLVNPVHAELRALFQLLHEQGRQANSDAEAGLLHGILETIAEYTENFNNDEIRAIFQESSLEHYLEGQLITPRHLGIKIGLIRKRRDERQTVHLSNGPGRR